jgi:hypothetical protein
MENVERASFCSDAFAQGIWYAGKYMYDNWLADTVGPVVLSSASCFSSYVGHFFYPSWDGSRMVLRVPSYAVAGTGA